MPLSFIQNQIPIQYWRLLFEAQEILDSIKACAGTTPLGLMAISMAFFNQCRDIIRHDLIAVVQNSIWWWGGIFDRSMNATFIALVPKKVGAIEVD